LSAIEIANFQYAFGMQASNQGAEWVARTQEGRGTNAQFKFQFYMRGGGAEGTRAETESESESASESEPESGFQAAAEEVKSRGRIFRHPHL